MNPILTKSFRAAGAMGGLLIAVFTATARQVNTAAAATDRVAGVTDSMGADVADQMVDLHQVGLAEVRLGATVAPGAPVMADAQGRAIAATKPAAGVVHYTAGTIQVGGDAGDIVPILVQPGAIFG